MKRNTVIELLVVAGLIGLMGCQQDPGNKDEQLSSSPFDLAGALPGTWEAVSIRVDIPTVDSTAVDSVFEVSEEYWVKKYTLRPFITVFQPDKKYRQEFRNNQDSLINEVKGIWNVFGDTLMLIEPNASYTYEVELARGLMTFSALMDWDADGQVDDTYKGVHRRISKEW